MNLALNKPATQSSTCKWSVDSRPDQDARNANNGNLEASECFHTDFEEDPWWQVDLEGIFIVQGIRIHNRPDQKNRLLRFKVLRSTNSIDWFEVFGKSDATSFNELDIDVREEAVARYIRISLDGRGFLHFRECEVLGTTADGDATQRLLKQDNERLRYARTLPHDKQGTIERVGGFLVFVDDERYSNALRHAIRSGDYEARERKILEGFLQPGHRVLEIGTAIGVVSMTAAAIAGASNVVTFDANPIILEDARDNFRRNGMERINARAGVLSNSTKFVEGATATFHVSRDFWTSRLDMGADGSDIVETISVPTFCLEQEIAAHQADVLICDIEGGEVDLLMDADLSCVDVIVLETHYWAAGVKAVDALFHRLVLDGFSPHLGASGQHAFLLRRWPRSGHRVLGNLFASDSRPGTSV